MHNLHFVVIKASSGQDACEQVESELMSFGNENNWRTMCGAVSQDDEVFDAGDGRYRPNESDLTTIELINECVNGWMKDCFYGSVAKEKLNKNEFNLDEWNPHELWSLSKYAEHLSQVSPFKDKSFNVLDDVLYCYKYDECGVTNMMYSDDSYNKVWVVFVDMHS